MGHKVNPNSIRLKITNTWKSRWFARGKKFADTLREDNLIRDMVIKKMAKAGLVRVDIERTGREINVIIHSTRPGMIIGKGGVGIEELKKQIKNALKIKTEFKITIEESKNINIEAQVWASTLAEQIEKRMSFRRIVKNALEQIMDAGALGVKIAVSGRLGGAEIARTEWLYRGKLPLHTLRANIDFARATAFTTYGTVGVKVWINKGEVFGNGKVVSNKL
ncbi:MAG: 30S ribosomal protein S3 [Candidatus Doudnabacteria bacterium RIFCSPHIGHO2_02_FULL_48_21]|uniref:Small ribosomal subunit protein uS3 n=1 Tax=Candidatus Doudnabacteria bacterium RIFCSPLOWO2_02_FULL_48_13 TaxID=1817845 RepID=A0A1F5QC18_9BACT|nr:ribosomal protein S3 [uncultured bacterium]OGE76242.1 MAG: 30S ribosomal protein S3 [Candidatus Doudnabacteria bacterium RIFCSPHIGHO2_01_48_18]OGE77513.1 MAG: 30S ribosomal protein S3 [Candidatus Doudnabacteria bacterium RIFCSPHIGHO2_01_FULL_48_180]OGE91654.1 MAG: 30S ribosomal protein S3 [Candidatus Doudnabacteria bacterium RIFCSPHIGHO2_12_FULL_47_25]OGE93348.1 MAG: 30S ribosomal protein S3 [Candidatus Doudnabacteria bacterium RIFCSPHIGHO2_02_FULL_48_21]OGE97432.1 MAG: 30S ribosomal protei